MNHNSFVNFETSHSAICKKVKREINRFINNDITNPPHKRYGVNNHTNRYSFQKTNTNHLYQAELLILFPAICPIVN